MWRSIKIICQIVSVTIILSLLKVGFEEDISKIIRDSPDVLEAGGNTIPSHHVAVITNPTNRSFLWCGGSVVSKRFVLTAAHCLENALNATIILNSTQNTPYSLSSSTFTVHPNWRPRLLQNDIALVELPQTSDLPDPSPVDISWNAKIATGRPGVVYGWKNGKPQPVWSKTDVVVISNGECGEHYGDLVTKHNVCAKRGGLANGCHGFSGGGLVIDGLLVGMVSFGADQCDLGYPTVYTRLSGYKRWIEGNLDP